MTEKQFKILEKHNIKYDNEINSRQGILDLLNPHVFYSDGNGVHALDFGNYIQVKYTNGFWGGFLGASDYINVKVYNEKQLENTIKYINSIKENNKEDKKKNKQ